MAKTVFDVLTDKLTDHKRSSEELYDPVQLKTTPTTKKCVVCFGVWTLHYVK